MTSASARVWITGGSSGIGEALAREYAAAGATVYLTARDRVRLDALVGELGPRAHSLPADVTDPAALSAALTSLDAHGGPPDLVILNAGTYSPMGLDNFALEPVRALFELNVFAVLHALELLLPGMRARGRGHIAVVSSLAGQIGLPYAGPYSASKAALERICQALRPEMECAGLRLSVVSPGFVRTPLTALNDFPMPFLVPPEKAARVIRCGLDAGHYQIRFPRRMSAVMWLLAALPESLSLPLRRRMLRR